MADNGRSNKSSRPSARASKRFRDSSRSNSGDPSKQAKHDAGKAPSNNDACVDRKDEKAGQNATADTSGKNAKAAQSGSNAKSTRRHSTRQGYKASRSKGAEDSDSQNMSSEGRESNGTAITAGAGASKASRSEKGNDVSEKPTYPSKKSESLPTSIKHTLFPTHVNQRKIYKNNPRVFYMNGESLARPMFFPRKNMMGLAAIVAVACIIAAIGLYLCFDATTNAPAREKAQVEELANKYVEYDLPNLLSFVELDDAAIDSSIKADGATYFERIPVGQGKEYEIIKLPPDVTLEQAAWMYANDIKNLSAADLVLLLNGAWRLNVDRSFGVNISLHYADFRSKSVDDAIEAAIASEDLERGGSGSGGDDDGYGNAYKTGTIMINGNSYTWTVSALPLKDYYDKAGIPDNATYLGIRIKNT